MDHLLPGEYMLYLGNPLGAHEIVIFQMTPTSGLASKVRFV